jgi:hypothetical protein
MQLPKSDLFSNAVNCKRTLLCRIRFLFNHHNLALCIIPAKHFKTVAIASHDGISGLKGQRSRLVF